MTVQLRDPALARNIRANLVSNVAGILALDEGRHGNEQAHKPRLELIRHSTFVRNVNDIVVEFGSARYQDVMDRYIRGEDDSGAAGAVRNGTLSTEEMSTWGVGRCAFLSACVA